MEWQHSPPPISPLAVTVFVYDWDVVRPPSLSLSLSLSAELDFLPSVSGCVDKKAGESDPGPFTPTTNHALKLDAIYLGEYMHSSHCVLWMCMVWSCFGVFPVR